MNNTIKVLAVFGLFSGMVFASGDTVDDAILRVAHTYVLNRDAIQRNVAAMGFGREQQEASQQRPRSENYTVGDILSTPWTVYKMLRAQYNGLSDSEKEQFWQAGREEFNRRTQIFNPRSWYAGLKSLACCRRDKRD